MPYICVAFLVYFTVQFKKNLKFKKPMCFFLCKKPLNVESFDKKKYSDYGFGRVTVLDVAV